jgi:hypothetical protein
MADDRERECWLVVDVAHNAEAGGSMGAGAGAVPAQRGAVGVQPCHHVAAYHVVADRRPPRQRARVAASAVCAGLLVAASVAVGRGWAGRAVSLEERGVLDARIVIPAGARPAAIAPAARAARPRALAPETVLITVPEGALAGQQFYFDVPGRGEYGAIVPEGKTPGDVLELEVTGSGAPIRSLAQRPYEDAVRASAVGPKAIKHVMYKALVSRGGEQNGHFWVDIPGRGLVDVVVPAGKKVGDELRFQLPPPDVGLLPDDRPGLAQIVRDVQRKNFEVRAPQQAIVTFSKPEEVRVTVPQGAVAGEALEVQGQGGAEFEVKVPGSVSGDKTDRSFIAILPSAPEPAAVKTAMGGVQRSSLVGRTQALAADDEKLANGDSSLSDAVTSAVTDAVQEAVQQAATQAAAEAEAEHVSAAPAAAGRAEAAAPPTPPAVPAAGAAEAVSPAGASDAFGHRDAEEAFNNGEPIVQQEVPDEYEGEAVAGPTASTNHFQVTVYEPITQKGRRSRGIANTWNFQNEVLCARMVEKGFCMRGLGMRGLGMRMRRHAQACSC